jgi:integrase
MASVAIIFRKDKLNSKKKAPVNFRIIKDRKISYVSAGIMLHEKDWDEKNRKVKKSHKNANRFNSFLANKFTELQDNVFEHQTFGKSVPTKKLKEEIYGKVPTNIFTFSDSVLESYKSQNMFGTHDKAKAIMNKLESFHGSRNLIFQDITPEFLNKYDTYCRSKWENKTNTVHKDMKYFRKLFNDAVRLEVIEMKENPFLKYKLKIEKTQRTFLSEDELTAFASVVCNPGTRMELHQDMFVFASYTGGLRVSDVLQLKWKNLDKSHINFTIQKTGTQLSILVPDKAMKIINKYKPKKIDKEHFIFPMLNNKLDVKDLRLMDKEISGATAYINKNLKEIAKIAEISKPISFHISRHTFATRALRKGISIDKVSKLMGHAAIRETQVYAKIVNEELDKAMEVFND